MIQQIKNRSLIFFLFIALFSHVNIIVSKSNIEIQNDINQHQVICFYQTQPKSQQELDRWNELVHTATYEVKQFFKNKYSQSTLENKHYPRHRDSVFFIHFNYNSGSWTLYKPSFISYKYFTATAKKIYQKHGLKVLFRKEQTIKILSSEQIGFDGDYFTLQELEIYKKMTADDFDTEIKKIENQSINAGDQATQINKLKKFKSMRKYFFWYLEIPTTGLLPTEYFDIDEAYKPLAWKFFLWDLAPKKGEGAQVAIIDTGVSAFNVSDTEFTDSYKKNVNIYTPSNLQSYGYNLVSENGLDPIRQIAINFGHYCDHSKFDGDELMSKLPEWIKDFIETNNYTQIEQYFTKNAKNESIDEAKSKLNQRGEELLQDLLYGKYGIAPKNSKTFFTVVNLESPYNEKALLETLPAPKIIGNDDPFSAGHGTFTQGIVNAKLYNNQGLTGLAPHAQVTMIKAFHDCGTTNKTTLNGALERALALKLPIVSMSLKITDSIDKVQDATLKKLIDSIDYVIAASGNDGDDPKLYNKEAYPAKFDSVAFDVGAFKYDDGNYSMCSFTQKETNIGPKFFAPGFDIFSSGLTPHQKSDSMYVFMSGTSVAVPVVTGFLALVLAEFQDVFTREEILKVIYKFSIRLNNDKNWQKDVALGTIDMRSCLLCLHALQSIRIELDKNILLKNMFIDNFDTLVEAVYILNYYIPSCYEKEFGCSLIGDFAHYQQAVQKKTKNSKYINFFTCSKEKTSQENLEDTINFIVDEILEALDTNGKSEINSDATSYKNLLQKCLSEKQCDLFIQLPVAFQNRINSALAPKEKFNFSAI